MNRHAVVGKFSHVKPGDTEFTEGGLRDFFLYRDLGIADATGGQVICHMVKANPEMPPEDGTGWHRHECDFQIVIMTKGWARFMYEDKATLVQAGDVVHQRPGIVHYLFDYSPDMEYLEIVSPADFKTVDMPPTTDKVGRAPATFNSASRSSMMRTRRAVLAQSGNRFSESSRKMRSRSRFNRCGS